ncbi:MAG: outer membrane beta-barrel protein [Polaribacter sp.]
MIKKIFFVSILLIQLSANAQKDSNWNVGIEFSIDNLSSSDNFIVTQGNVNGYNIKFNKNNFNFGLVTNYLIQKKIKLSTGILFSNKDVTATYNCISCVHIGTFPGYPPEKIKQRFIVIPIAVNYELLKGKIRPVLNGGFKNNIKIKNDLKEQSKSYFLEAFVGASIHFNISKNLETGIGYNYQINVTNLYNTNTFNLETNNYFLKINYNI